MSFKNKGSQKISGKTTTEYWEVDYTRAVLTITYDFKGALTPNKANDWGLRDNPCWPEGIVPEDPGYVLLTSDEWYKTAANSAALEAQKALYTAAPPANLLAAAKARRPDVQVKRDSLSFDLFALEDGGLALRGANSSRRITEEEAELNVEVVDCADRVCSGELVDLKDEAVVLIEGAPEVPPSRLPAINLDTAPTPLIAVVNPRRTPTGFSNTMVTMVRSDH
ncbi:hypothetical protein K505DRAFT_231180 [Melanomma pulvis-pyrius CBS 109.77]|uniref:Uncharacterized protein n=1 Tax=Melanomma pulvis-pyrius CBS 109.77 TaxID=1314802 RepID=A0A6A6XT43_9PLEO|nr:hypothetical protein K505DRAFT_231180 [Melanomma pulvis-pyrius CBS 109.77]